jgi:hypothetical protein
MPSIKAVSLESLDLDLNNYRVTKQKSEIAEIKALISAKPDKFWALMNSLLEDGYHSTENIIVLKEGAKKIVKEGNRRVASLKIILGQTRIKKSELPSDINEKIKNLSEKWISENSKIPCVIYSDSEALVCEKVVALTHAKGVNAGRDTWSAIARARYDKDQGKAELGLDLLEKFLAKSTIVSKDQKVRWGGDYPITVLNEVVSKIYPLLGLDSAHDVSPRYPKIKCKAKVDLLIHQIGHKVIGFKDIRTENFFYKFLELPVSPIKLSGSGSSSSGEKYPVKAEPSPKSTSSVALSNSDPNSVRAILKKFKPMGDNREKLVALVNEARALNIAKHPHAFCFLLRSMFEISAKVYAKERRVKITNSKGVDKPLATLLREIVEKMTKNKSDRELTRTLHGPITEIAKSEGLLSVTSLNQLVHNTRFSIAPSDISRLFSNIFPLLEEMNK